MHCDGVWGGLRVVSGVYETKVRKYCDCPRRRRLQSRLDIRSKSSHFLGPFSILTRRSVPHFHLSFRHPVNICFSVSLRLDILPSSLFLFLLSVHITCQSALLSPPGIFLVELCVSWSSHLFSIELLFWADFGSWEDSIEIVSCIFWILTMTHSCS